MIVDPNYVPMEGDIIKMLYDTHNEDTNLGTGARKVHVTKSCYFNPAFRKGTIFNALCEDEIKNFYTKRIMFATIDRHSSLILYSNNNYDLEFNYIGPEGQR